MSTLCMCFSWYKIINRSVMGVFNTYQILMLFGMEINETIIRKMTHLGKCVKKEYFELIVYNRRNELDIIQALMANVNDALRKKKSKNPCQTGVFASSNTYHYYSEIWWSRTDSNRPPQQCECCALPDELLPHGSFIITQKRAPWQVPLIQMAGTGNLRANFLTSA